MQYLPDPKHSGSLDMYVSSLQLYTSVVPPYMLLVLFFVIDILSSSSVRSIISAFGGGIYFAFFFSSHALNPESFETFSREVNIGIIVMAS